MVNLSSTLPGARPAGLSDLPFIFLLLQATPPTRRLVLSCWVSGTCQKVTSSRSHGLGEVAGQRLPRRCGIGCPVQRTLRSVRWTSVSFPSAGGALVVPDCPSRAATGQTSTHWNTGVVSVPSGLRFGPRGGLAERGERAPVVLPVGVAALRRPPQPGRTRRGVVIRVRQFRRVLGGNTTATGTVLRFRTISARVVFSIYLRPTV